MALVGLLGELQFALSNLALHHPVKAARLSGTVGIIKLNLSANDGETIRVAKPIGGKGVGSRLNNEVGEFVDGEWKTILISKDKPHLAVPKLDRGLGKALRHEHADKHVTAGYAAELVTCDYGIDAA